MVAVAGRKGTVLLSFCAALLGACGGGGGGGRTDGGNPPGDNGNPGNPSLSTTVQFDLAAAAVTEGADTVSLTLTRSGRIDGAISLALAGTGGSAANGTDYTLPTQTIAFGDREVTKAVAVARVLDDSEVEIDETLLLTLSSSDNSVTVGANKTFTLTIQDNDPVPAPSLAVRANGVKHLEFSWQPVTGATNYRLQYNNDGPLFQQVGAELPAASTSTITEVPMHRLDWVNGRYRLQACAGTRCTSSPAISAASEMLGTIGYVKATNAGLTDELGSAIALSADGSTLAIAAVFEDGPATTINDPETGDDFQSRESGAVYVFTRGATGWIQQAYVKAPNAAAQDGFGSAIALDATGDTLAVGAVDEDGNGAGGLADNSVQSAGAVYVFTRSAGQWSFDEYLKAFDQDGFDAQPFAKFGQSIALSGNGKTLAVGAPFLDTNRGAAYVFARSTTTWERQQQIIAPNAQQGDTFGIAVALNGDGTLLAVSAMSEDSGTNGVGTTPDEAAKDSGAVYTFVLAGTTWAHESYIKASNSGAGDSFGTAIALSDDGSTLAVGAPSEDSGASGVNNPNDGDVAATENAGAAYVFERAQNTWSQRAYVKATNPDNGDLFGEALALSANGRTLAIGAIREDSPATGVNNHFDRNDGDSAASSNSGAVYVLTLREEGWTHEGYIKALNTGMDDAFGDSVALDNTGDTLAIGASQEDGAPGDPAVEDMTNSGAVYLY